MHGSTKRSLTSALPRWSDMQGLILSAYPHLDQAVYLLYRIDDEEATRRWLGSQLPGITSAFRNVTTRSGRSMRPRNVNVAFTASGLRRLCTELRDFDQPFEEGMQGTSHRRRVLGDTGRNDPSHWRWGAGDRFVDLLLIVYVHAEDSLAGELESVCPPRTAMHLVVPPIIARRLSEAKGREHFGFTDGISQPILAGSIDSERFPESRHVTALGEFVLGYPNSDGQVKVPSVDRGPQFGRNGTYLVMRQLQQDVAAFHRFAIDVAASAGVHDESAAQRFEAKIVGRRQDGTPLVPDGNRWNNEFGFAEDPYGHGCPIGAHIRRSNPRDSLSNTNLPLKPKNDHRILRRGRSFGEPFNPLVADDRDRGLIFVALNADIERQFEFIQQNWINGAAFGGLDGERDPLLGGRGPADDASTFTMSGVPAPLRVSGVPQFVTVVGGQYFFVPGVDALHQLARV